MDEVGEASFQDVTSLVVHVAFYEINHPIEHPKISSETSWMKKNNAQVYKGFLCDIPKNRTLCMYSRPKWECFIFF